MRPRRRSAPTLFVRSLSLGGIFLAASFAGAQPVEPISRVAADVHLVTIALPHDAGTAAPRGLEPDDLPSRGIGFDAGVHVYPWRTRILTLGVGAALLWSRGTQSPAAATDGTTAPSVTTRLRAFSPQVSLNFGTGRGWSYISGGIGSASISVSRSDLPAEDAQTARALNYGAGARWFFRRHLAFSFDIRFYSVDGKQPSGGSLGFSKKTYFGGAAGISLK
jgi:hypothetical protein